MTTAMIHPRRSWMPAFSLALAGGATVLSLVAITSDDVGSTTGATPAPVVVRAPEGWGGTEAQRQWVPDLSVTERMPAGWPATEVMRRDAETHTAANAEDPCAHRLRTSMTC
jgi:hypothetical protein